MKKFIKNIIIIVEAFFYNIYMTCHPRFRSEKIKIRQVSVGDINPTTHPTYKWKKLNSEIIQLGVLKPIKVICRDNYNEYGELTYSIGDGHHRYYLLTQDKRMEDTIKVYRRFRTEGERQAANNSILLEEAVQKVNSKQKIYNKQIKKNFSYNSHYTLFNSYGKN